LKKETGMNTQDYIHAYLIEEARNLLVGTDLSVRAMAYTLGFEYPQYFSRLFKSKSLFRILSPSQKRLIFRHFSPFFSYVAPAMRLQKRKN
jgi:AraC-like DNA-binding protein